MALTKLVNGKRATLSPEEEAKVRAEWEANRLKKQERQAQQQQLEQEKQAIRLKLAEAAGISPDDLEKVLK